MTFRGKTVAWDAPAVALRVYPLPRRPPKYIRYSNRSSLDVEAYFESSVCTFVGGNWSNSALYRFSAVGEKDPGIPFLEVLGIGMMAGAVTRLSLPDPESNPN
jgi:hypothetical protein